MTQGKDLAELEVMLADLYVILKEEARYAEIKRQEIAKQCAGTLRISAGFPV